MSDTTSPPSVHLYPLSPSSSMSSTDSAPQSEPTSDEQPDLGAFTTVLRAWTYLQPPPRIPVQIYSPTSSTTTTFQPDQSVADSDFPSRSRNSSSHAPPSSFTRPPSSSVVHEESTVWNHAPIASYLYSETPSLDHEDEGSTEGGRTVEINSESSFDDHSSSVPSQHPYLDVPVPVSLEPPSLLLTTDLTTDSPSSSALISHLRNISRNPLPPSSSSLSLLSYQIPETPLISIQEESELVVAPRVLSVEVSTTTTSASLKSQRAPSSSIANSISTSTPTFGPLLATSALPVQKQHRTVPIHPPPQTVSDDASVSHLSLPPPGDSPLQPMPASLHHPNSNPHPHPHSHPHLNSHPSPNPNPNPHPYPPQQQAPPTSIPQPQPTLGMEASISTSLLTQRGVGGGLGTIVVDDLRTPDQTPDSFSVDWRRSGRSGRFRPVDDHEEVEVVEKRSHTYGFGFGFGRVQQQGRGQGQKHVSGYTSNYEGSQSSFRARKSSEMKGRSTRLESQNEDNEDTGTYSDLAEHCYEDQDRDEEEEDSPFPRRRGRFYSQSHTPRYYGRTHTPPGGVLPTQPPLQQSIGQTQSQSSSGLNYDRYSQTQPNIHTLQPQHHLDSNHSHSDPHSDPEPYPRPHARPLIQDGDRDDNIYPSNSNSHSSMSSMSSLSSLLPSSSPPCSNEQPSPSISSSVQQDYVLVQPQTQPLVQMPVELFSQQSQSQLPQTQTQTSYPVSYLSTQNPGPSYLLTTMTSLDLAPVSAPVPVSTSAVSLSVPPSVVSVSIIPVVPNSPPAAAAAATSSGIYQGQGTGTSQHHKDPPPLLLSSASAKLGPCSISSPSALPSNLIETLKPDKSDETEGGGKSGTPDKPERARWDCVDLEEDELVPVSGRSSSVGGGVNSGSGLTSVLGISQPPPKAQKSRPTNKLSAKQQQRRRPLEIQFRQFDALTLPHVESDSGGWEDGGIGLASATTTSTITATSTSTIISTTNDSQPPDPDPDPNPNSNPQHARTNDNPHSHSHSDSHRYSQSHYPGFHSDSHVAHMEDTESDLDLDDNLGAVDVDDHDAGARAPATVRVRRGAGGAGSPGGDALLPSLGYLDEALRFIAAERARWSAAREVGGPSGSGAGGGATKRGGRKTEDRKVLDYDMDAPKRKRRRKRPPKWQHQPHVLPSSNPGALDTAVAPPPTTAVPLNPLHVADEDGGGPSTPTSSARKKKRARSSSWSPVKKKHGSNSSKGKEKEFLVAPPQPSSPPLDTAHPPPLLAISAQGERDQLQPISVVPRSKPGGWLLVKGQDQGFSKKDEDGGRTPTNGGGVMEDVFGPVTTGSTILSSGKRGKKNMGKKEKERERMKKDLLIGRSTGKEVAGNCGHEAVEDEEDDHGDNDDDDEKEQDDDDDDDDDDDISIEDNSSLNDLSILQPPRSKLDPSRRQKGKDIAYIHSRAGIAGGGAYKSTPGSPKRRRGFDDDIHVDREESGHGSLGDRDVDVEDNAVVPYTGPGKKHTPSKRVKGLVHVRSVPQLRLGAEETPTLYAAPEETTVSPSKVKSKKAKLKAAVTAAPAPAHNGSGGVDLLDMGQPQTKRSRLIVLTKKLREFFPEQREALRRVTIRLERQGIGKGKKNFLTSGGSSGGGGLTQRTSVPIPVPGVRKLKRGIHYRTVNEGASVDADDDFIEGDGVGMPEVDEEDEELDPRGRPPKKSDVLIHVFIDHSNILIGLLSHLRRFPLTHAVSKGTKRGHPLPTIPAKATPTVSMSHVTTSALAFASVKPTSARPLPNPNSIISGNSKVSSSSIPIAVPGDHHPIPLPSFATMSRSLPSGSILNKYPEENNDVEEKDARSDGYESHRQGENDEDVDDLGQITSLARAWKPGEKEKRSLKHLWHAALVLLLERGRSVTRRVIVTSSPLYQPMDGIERLGYELRVYVRVPDLGNGMDRDRHKDKGVSGSLSGGSKSAQSSPANAVSFSGLPLSTRKNKREMLGHVRRFSGSTSTESGSGGGGSGHASGTSNPHSYHGIANNTPPQGKIKYREQGVDELLQLKLHQALAATDDVPKGSTIVLATGDGNMGQFNEEGFLGPVRTALKRGWKVELYAWEDGLSRAWRREFGEGTEWGRKGMFRVIGMEQFAGSLVEIIDQ